MNDVNHIAQGRRPAVSQFRLFQWLRWRMVANAGTLWMGKTLDTPLKRLFDYLPPDWSRGSGDIPSGKSTLQATPIAPGMRVRVPFGRQKLIGQLI